MIFVILCSLMHTIHYKYWTSMVCMGKLKLYKLYINVKHAINLYTLLTFCVLICLETSVPTCTLAPLIVYAAFRCHNCAPNACKTGAVETKTSASFDIVQCEGIIITHTLNAYMLFS